MLYFVVDLISIWRMHVRVLYLFLCGCFNVVVRMWCFWKMSRFCKSLIIWSKCKLLINDLIRSVVAVIVKTRNINARSPCNWYFDYLQMTLIKCCFFSIALSRAFLIWFTRKIHRHEHLCLPIHDPCIWRIYSLHKRKTQV